MADDLTKLGFFAVADGADENRAASRTKLRQLQMHDRNSYFIRARVKNKRAKTRPENFDHDLRFANEIFRAAAKDANIVRQPS